MDDIYFRQWQDKVYVKCFNFYARKKNFEKKKSISFVMAVCPSVRPSVRRHGIILLPLGGFSCNSIFAYFSKICRKKTHTLIKIWQSYGITYMRTNINFWSYLTQLFLEWEMTHIKVAGKIKKMYAQYLLTYLLTYLLHGAESFFSSYSRNSPHFTEHDGSLPHSKPSATCLYPGPAQSSPYTHIPPSGDPS